MPKPASHSKLAASALSLPVCFGPVMAVAFASPDKLPQRFKIAAWGENVARGQGPDGEDKTILVNATTASVLASMQHARGFDKVALDFNHQSDPKSKTYKPDPRHDAGHGTIEVVEGDGLYYCAADYTPAGLEFAPNYSDVSGVFWTNKKGEVLFVSSVALCQNGAIAGAEFREADVLAACVMQAIACSLDSYNGLSETDRVVAVAREFLQFDDTATPSDVAAALDALTRQRNREAEIRSSQSQPTPNKPSTTKNMEDKQFEQLQASVKTLADGQAAILKRIEADDKTRAIAAHNTAVEAVITASISAGKVVPATIKTKDTDGRYVMSADAAKEIMDVIPATVQTEFQNGVARQTTSLNQGAKSEEAEVMAALGIDEAAWKKGGIQRAWEPAPSGVPDVK